MGNEVFITVLVAIGFLTVAAFASLGLKKLNFPYTIGLVVIGLVTGLLAWQFEGTELVRNLGLSPEIIMYLILPCLIFDAAINIDVRLLVRNLVPILLLAAPGLVISTFAVGYGLSWLTFLPLAGALVFGALISATDPVAVIALFKDIGAPRRLVTLVDGESVFNDATAIVMFTIVMAAIGVSGSASADIDIAGGIMEFIMVLLGGLVIGGLIGFLGSLVFQLDKSGLEFQKIISLIVAYGSFMIADHLFHFSGVMASLAAGLIIRYRAEVTVKLANIENIEHAWGFFSFVANSFVFILLGLTEIHLILYKGNILDSLGVILISIPVVLVARALCIWPIVPIYNQFRKRKKREPIPLSYQAVIFWGGLRGAVPVALVLAIPLDFPNRDTILHVTMANILFTLLVQGTTIKWLMDRLGVKPDDSEFDDRIVVDSSFAFPDPGLSRLVVSRLQEEFSGEGFLVKEKPLKHGVEYLMRKGRQIIGFHVEGNSIIFTSEKREKHYINTVMQETLRELRGSVASIQNLEPVHEPATEINELSLSFDLMKLIPEEHIKVPLLEKSKQGAVIEMIGLLAATGVITDADQVLIDVMERERKVNTGMGDGLAIPHARTSCVSAPVLALGLQPDGLDYQSSDGKPVRLMVLMLSPKNDAGPHLEILSAIGRILNNEGIRQALFAAKNSGEIRRSFKKAVGTHHRELI